MVLAIAVLGLVPMVSWHLQHQFPNLAMEHGGDPEMIVTQLRLYPHFSDTLKWWYGPWLYSHAWFFRPLPSLVFWTEYKLFGYGGLVPFTVILWASHVALCGLLYAFLRRLISPAHAIAATCIWATHCLSYLTLPNPSSALYYWIDTVEIQFGLLAFGFLWICVTHLKGESERARFWALPAFLLCILFKEMGYILPFLMLILAFHLRAGRRVLGLWPLLPIAIACYAYRAWALGFKENTFGPNRAWWWRALMNLGAGNTVSSSVSGDFLPFAIAAVLAAAGLLTFWFFRRPAHKRAWLIPFALLAGAAGLCTLTDYFSQAGWGDAALRMTAFLPWYAAPAHQKGILCLALGMLWFSFLHRRHPTQVLGLLWAYVSYLPLLATVTTEHTLYLPSIGWALWFSAPLCTVLRHIYEFAGPFTLPSVKTGLSPTAEPATEPAPAG